MECAIRTRWRGTASLVLVALVFSLFIAGCGGGGSGSGNADGNTVPTADAGPDQTVEEDTAVTLDGSRSSDTDGTIVSYLWTQISGPAVTINNADNVMANYIAPNVLSQKTVSFRLTVTDNAGAQDSDEVSNTVMPVNEPPIAVAGEDLMAPEQTLVTLDGSKSSDSDGTIEQYSWTQTSGTTVTLNNADTANPSFTAPTPANLLTFKLTVTDNEGATTSDEVVVSVVNILFSEDFDDGNDQGWTRIDNTGSGSSWAVINGEYYQNNVMVDGFFGNPFEQSYHVGTYSFVNSGFGFTNYRLSVEITPLRDENGGFFQGNDVGMMFRYVDDNNYYRFTINSSNGFSRLEKRINGTFHTLALDARGYIEGESLAITVEVIDSYILVYVDEDPLFSVSDWDLASGTIALYSQDKVKFDNVIVTGNSLIPAVIISSPVAYSIASTDSGTIDVSAIVTNIPTGGEVVFILDDDDGKSFIDATAPYSHQFSGIVQGEHKLEAILQDDKGSELSRDTNERIGVLGDYYVAIGDSITNGYGDNYAADNISDDGRIVAFQGYQSGLNDLLTYTYGYPHVIFDEGIGGDRSIEALDRIDSVLERHPTFNKALVLLGTNDAGNGVSAGTFQQNMQDLIDAIPVGNTVWVAMVPPFFNDDGSPDTATNNRVVQYNSAITQLNNVEPGPDFYEYFLGSGRNRSSLFTDGVHPNGLGQTLMAYLWHNSISTGSPLALPLVLEDLNPLNYKQNLLEVGDQYYIDESFALTSIPQVLTDGIWIMTANADKNNSDADYLSFEVDRNVIIYVAYDATASVLPGWMLPFTDTGLQVGATNGSLNLYRRDYASGTIMLGGNSAGGDGAVNYTVIVIAQ